MNDLSSEAGRSPTVGVNRIDSVVEDLKDRVFVRNRESVDLDDGLAAILVPRFDGSILGRFLMPRLKKPFFKIRLDGAGAFVWKMLDGERTVGEIADFWAARFPEEPLPVARVALFVRALALQGHAVETDRRESLACGGPPGDNPQSL